MRARSAAFNPVRRIVGDEVFVTLTEFTNGIAGTGGPITIDDPDNTTNRNYRVRVMLTPLSRTSLLPARFVVNEVSGEAVLPHTRLVYQLRGNADLFEQTDPSTIV